MERPTSFPLAWQQLHQDWAPDRRVRLWELSLIHQADGQVRLSGHHAYPPAEQALHTFCQTWGLQADWQQRSLGPVWRCTTLTPLRSQPSHTSELLTQYEAGQGVFPFLGLEQGAWWRVQGEEGYIGWVEAALLEAWSAPTWQNPAPAPLEAETLLSIARQALGTPYLWGGTTLGGLDCSGLLQWTWRQLGHILPRDASQQVALGREVACALDQLLPADALFFGEMPGRITHVALYEGGGRYLHASQGRVRYNSLVPGEPDYDHYRALTWQATRRLLGS